jgi:hypothetical protein
LRGIAKNYDAIADLAEERLHTARVRQAAVNGHKRTSAQR